MAQRGVNKAIIMGALGRDPETRHMPNGDSVCNFSVATSEAWKDKQSGEQKEATEWHRIVCWRRTAEIAGQYLKKGSKVYIEGRLQTRKWTDKDGIERYQTEIVADSLQLLDRKEGGQQARQSAPQGNSRDYDYPDDDIPF